MEQKVWTVGRCLGWTQRYLADCGERRPRLAAEWLLCAATGLTRIDLYTGLDRPLAPPELDAMHGFVVRRAQGEPLQYIAGETAFRTITVACERGVLIPRPETELLVEEVLAFLDREDGSGSPQGSRADRTIPELPWNRETAGARPDGASEARRAEIASDPRRILEIGCGTGCISLSIASERAGRVTCVATDIAPEAVALARRNRSRLGLDAHQVSIREGDLADPVAPEERRSFDALVSNPPYVPHAVMDDLPEEVVAFEPALALDGGRDGLDVFRRLVGVASDMVRPRGLFACELHEDALEDAAAIARAAHLDDVEIIPDLAGRPRILLARVPHRTCRASPSVRDGAPLTEM